MVIAHNTFTKNAGYLDASAVYVRARGRNGVSVYSTTPDDANIFCVGYHFESNTFTENFGCPRRVGAVVKLECVDYADTSGVANDRITPSTLTTPSSWSGMTFSYTSTPLSLSYTYGGVTKTVSGDYKQVTFKSNTFTRNAASNGHGVVDLLGIPRVIINSENYKDNGDSIADVLTLYGSGIMTAATGEKTID